MKPTSTLALFAVLAAALAAPVGGAVRPRGRESEPPGGLKPDRANLAYGPHPRNVLALWQAESAAPTPVVVHVHGYLFRQADPMQVPEVFLKGCLEGGISVASIDYRYVIDAPLPAAMRDAARAVQFLRHRAGGLDLDPDRVAVTGISTGGSAALWVALHGDVADADADDPVARQSSRVRCAAVWDAPTTLDPAYYRRHRVRLSGGPATLSQWCGLAPGREEGEVARSAFAEVSPLAHASEDDPPVFLNYAKPQRYVTGELGLHHPIFGRTLRTALVPLGVPCILREGKGRAGQRVHGSGDADRAILAFVVRHLQRKTEPPVGPAPDNEVKGPPIPPADDRSGE